MKLFRKMVAGLLAAASALSAGAVQLTAAPAAAAGDAVRLVEEMGMGWNLGNTFDSAPVKAWANSELPYVDSETGWGNPKTTKAMIAAIKNTGFDTVRIPVTWFENMDAAGNVDADYLARVKEVVDYCIDQDLHVILNVHHDGASEGANAASNAYKSTIDGAWLWQGTSQKAKFTSLWKQIAEYFKAYDSRLAFAGWNEISWDYTVEKEMGQAFIDTVRATGGSNASRLLIVPANNTNLDAALASGFQLPTDSADMMAVEIHYYSPPEFSIRPANASWGQTVNTWGSASEINEMKNDVNKLYQAFASKGTPVIIGECGVLTNEQRDKASIRAWIQTLFSASLGYDGICPVLWDSGDCGDMQYFGRAKLAWNDPELETVFKTMTGTATNTTTTYTFDMSKPEYSENEDANFPYYLDLKPFKGVADIIGVMIKGHGTGTGSDPCFGVTVAFNGYFGDEEPYETPSEYKWMYQQISYGIDAESYQFMFAEENISWNKPTGETDADGNDVTEATAAGVFDTDWHLAYDYLQLQSWWNNNAKDYALDSVTLIFDAPVVLDSNGDIVVTTEPAKDTTTTTTTTTTTVETTTSKQEETTGAPEKIHLKGDVDCSGEVNIADAVMLARFNAEDKEIEVSAQGKANADCDGVEGVGAGDLSALLEYLAGLGELIA